MCHKSILQECLLHFPTLVSKMFGRLFSSTCLHSGSWVPSCFHTPGQDPGHHPKTHDVVSALHGYGSDPARCFVSGCFWLTHHNQVSCCLFLKGIQRQLWAIHRCCTNYTCFLPRWRSHQRKQRWGVMVCGGVGQGKFI